MLELLATIDPFTAVLTGLWMFSAGLFPLGFMLGSQCSPCCGCSLCTEGSLPETLTVTFAGLADKTQGPDLIGVSFSSCYGSGGTAKVTAPGGDPATDKGPITAVSLTNGGSGYAKLGRVAPTLTISGGSGTGATFTPTLSTSQDGCKLDLWSLASVAASGGTGYEDGDTLTITFADGDTEAAAAQATLYLDKSEPTITLDGTATATIGLGVTVTPTWVVNDVTVTNGGTGYTEGGAVTFSAGANDVTVTAAAGNARVVHDAPDNAVLTIDTAGGSGAVLTPVWTLLPSGQWPAPHKKTYKLQSVTVVNGGTGYANYELISISFASPDDGTVNQAAYIDCDVVGTGGVIQSIFIADPGDIFTPAAAGRYVGSRTDELHSVEITNAGEYYEDDPGARYVVVDNGGSYYREDPDETPYVASVTVTVSDELPSAGSGATLIATVDDNTESATFGQIVSLAIDDGGDGYLAWEWKNTKCCGSFYNGMSVVVKRNNGTGPQDTDGPCTYTHHMCGVGNMSFLPGMVHVHYRGPSEPPIVYLVSEGPASGDNIASLVCNTTFTTEHLVTDCGTWLDDEDQPIEFTATGEATATVTVGGEYASQFKNPDSPYACHICCKGEEAPPLEVETTLVDPRPVKTGGDRSGTYVLAISGPSNVPSIVDGGWLGPALRWVGGRSTGGFVSVNVLLEPCSYQWRVKNTAPLRQGFPQGFEPDGSGCDHCHNKCRVWAWVAFGPGDNAFDCGWYSDNGCGVCEESPICSPVGRTFNIPNASCGQLTLAVD